MKQKLFSISVKRLGVALIVFLIGLLGAVLTLLFLTGNRVVSQYVNDMGNNSLHYYQADLDRSLEDLTQFCKQNLSNTRTTLAYNAQCDEETAFALKQDIRSTLQQLFQINGNICYIQYCPSTSTHPPVRLTKFSSLSEAEAVAQTDPPKGTWQWYSINGKDYLCTTAPLSDGACVICLNSSFLTSVNGQMTDLSYSCEQDGKYIGGIPDGFREEAKKLPIFLIQGEQHLLFSCPSSQGAFQVCCFVSTAELSLQRSVRHFYVAVLALLLLLSMVGFFVIRHTVQSFGVLDKACASFGEGELDTRITQPTRFLEAAQIYGTFNRMAEQIQNLKISLYEHELAEQHSKMALLRTQIKSHFFINCLNIIFSLASVGNDALIKEFSLCLVDYFRYLGSGFQDTVRLGEELEHLKNYVRIFEIRYPGRVNCTWYVEPELEKFKLIPMILQTFVENVFHHAMSPGEAIGLEIHVARGKYLDNAGVVVEISDTGPGFPINMLEQPDEHTQADAPKHGNGIRNTRQRMELFYQGTSELVCENTLNGAYVRLFFPEIS